MGFGVAFSNLQQERPGLPPPLHGDGIETACLHRQTQIVRRFNDLYRPVLKEPEALISPVPRLPGPGGRHKMSKSNGNALDASPEETAKAIQKAVTDPSRIRNNDPCS
jgi:tryptophanyl-tRNA synthetase